MKNKLQNQNYKILVTGGGTGGHVMPLEAVIDELKKHDLEILYIGSGLGIEKEMAVRQRVAYKSVLSGKLRRYLSWRNFVDPLKIIVGFFQAIGIILSYKPEVIFAKGGYVTIPIVLAGWVLGKKIITHESDVVMGLANCIEARLAKKICVGFPVENYPDLLLQKIVYTGNPVRKEFFKSYQLSVISHQPVILVTGGSQGARFINQTIAAILPKLTQFYQVIHLSGKSDYSWLAKNSWPNYQLLDFTDEMPLLMQKANLIISRAGANTLAEIATLAKPAILIPLPSAAGNHQLVNAKILEKSSAAVVLQENNLTPENLLEIINLIINDKNISHDLGRQIAQFAQSESSKMIVEEILHLV